MGILFKYHNKPFHSCNSHQMATSYWLANVTHLQVEQTGLCP